MRIFTLQNLDHWPQAELTLRQAREVAQRSGNTDRATWANAAVLRYWLGEWDDALAELGPEDAEGDAYLRERWSALLIHGVAALIAGRRDERTAADQQLRQGLALSIQTLTDRENQDFLVAAHALALEQDGEARQAAQRLAAMLPRRDGEMTLVHQWMPDLVRLALAAGDRPMAQAAARACQAEAAAETRPARAAAASLRCAGSLSPIPPRSAKLSRTTGRSGRSRNCPPRWRTWPSCWPERGRDEDARTALTEAVPSMRACRPGGTSGAPRGGSVPTASGTPPRPAGPARGHRLGGTHPDRGQGRRPGGPGRLDVGHRPGHVLVAADRPDLHLAHPRQARRQGPGGHRPRGTAPGCRRSP